MQARLTCVKVIVVLLPRLLLACKAALRLTSIM